MKKMNDMVRGALLGAAIGGVAGFVSYGVSRQKKGFLKRNMKRGLKDMNGFVEVAERFIKSF